MSKPARQQVKDLAEDFECSIVSLEELTATILSSEKGFTGMSKMLKEDLADRLQRVRIYLLFSNGIKT